ncbi:MAG: His/Gly/Thr/Pro-type tRNA ligase C-terminal domain-containing protein [Verrucomicrobiota bacterium]
MTLNADDNLIAYAKDIAQQLRAAEVRVTSDLGPEPIKAKIAEAGTAKAHTVW